jgi:hypothetical protein
MTRSFGIIRACSGFSAGGKNKPFLTRRENTEQARIKGLREMISKVKSFRRTCQAEKAKAPCFYKAPSKIVIGEFQ